MKSQSLSWKFEFAKFVFVFELILGLLAVAFWTSHLNAHTTTCGNGIVEHEDCDDGNTITETCERGDTSCHVCDSTCHIIEGETSFCGDEIVQDEFEECDGDELCSEDCELMEDDSTFCGDGAVQLEFEQCDDGNDINTDDCKNDCTVQSCEDDVVGDNEDCSGNPQGGDSSDSSSGGCSLLR